jgi:hypothetical protein
MIKYLSKIVYFLLLTFLSGNVLAGSKVEEVGDSLYEDDKGHLFFQIQIKKLPNDDLLNKIIKPPEFYEMVI